MHELTLLPCVLKKKTLRQLHKLCLQLISWYGWEAVFYFTGIVGVLWFVAWWLLVFDTPRKHPRISEIEMIYIEKKLGDTVQNKCNV